MAKPEQTGVKRPLWRRALRVLAWIGVGLLILVLLLGGGVLVVSNTDYGRGKLLALVLPLIRGALLGELKIGRIEGSLLHGLILRDIELRDSEGQLAVRAPRVAVRYNLWALRAKTVHVTSGQIEGLYVHARTLRDGRLNLAALVKPKEKPSGPLPVGFRVEDVYVVGSARYDLAPARADDAAAPFNRVEAGLRLAVGARVPLGAGPIEAQIKGLEVAVQAPLPATLTLRGGAKIQGSAVSVDKLELGLKAALPDVGRLLPAFGDERARWLPGEVRLDLSADGTLQAMNLALALHLPPAGAEAGQLSFQGQVGQLDAALPWRFELSGSGLAPAALRSDLPPLQVGLVLAGQGQGLRGAVELRGLWARGFQTRAAVSGKVALVGEPGLPRGPLDPLALLGDGDARVAVEARDLRGLAPLGTPPTLRGALTLHATAQRHGRLQVQANALGRDLGFAAVRLGRLELAVASPDVEALSGQVDLRLRALAAGGLLFEHLELSGRGDPKSLQVSASGHGPKNNDFALSIRGRPLRDRADASRVVGAEATLQRLMLSTLGQRWQNQGEAQLWVDPQGQARAPAELSLRGLRMASEAQRLEVSGRFLPKQKALRARVAAQHLDVAKILALLQPRPDPRVPRTDIDVTATAEGPLANPTAEVTLRARADAAPGFGLGKSQSDLSVRYQEQRIKGTLSLRSEPLTLAASAAVPLGQPGAQISSSAGVHSETSATNTAGRGQSVARSPLLASQRPLQPVPGPELDGSFDVTLPRAGAGIGSSAVQADLKVSASLEGFRRALPPALAQLAGRVSVALRVSGTVRRPEVDLQVTAPVVETELAHARTLRLSLLHRPSGAQPGLRLQLTSQIDTAAAERAGTLDLSLSTPLVLDPLNVGALTPAALRREALELSLAAKLDVGLLARGIMGPKAPITAGLLDASLKASGSAAAPILQLSVNARGLTTPTIPSAGLTLNVAYQKEQATLGLDVLLRDSTLVRAQGQTALALPRLMAGSDWRDLPLQLVLTIPDFDLARVSSKAGAFAGRLNGKVTLAGTMGQPQAQAEVRGDGLRVREWQAGDLRVQASYRGGERVIGQVTLSQPKGGSLRADVNVPMAAGLPVTASLDARGLQLGYRDDPQHRGGVLRELTGRLDSDLRLRGTLKEPKISGGLRLQNSTLALSLDPRQYTGIEVDVRMDESGHIVVRRIAASADGGKAELSGDAQLEGFKPVRADLKASAQRFPVAAGAFGLWIDARLVASLRRDGGVLRTLATITDATVNLPQITAAASKNLQPTKPLDDVVFVDGRALREEAQRVKEQAQRDSAKQQRDDQDASKYPTAAVLQIEVPGPLQLRGKEINADAEASISVELRGPLAVVSGSARTLGGRVELLGKRYELDRALVRLDGAIPPNPDLSVQVSRRLRDASIIIEISGKALKPRITFRSDPPIYSESQVIAILVSGSDPSQAGGATRSLDQKVVGAVSGLLVNQLKDQIASQLPLDVLKVDLGGEGYGYNQTRVEVGKYLLDNLYVSYVHQFGAQNGTLRTNANEVRMEYRFLRDFVLNTIFGDAGVGAIDLYWTRRF